MATEHQLFVHRYLDRSVVEKDSVRFRVRVKTLFQHAISDTHLSSTVDEMLRLHAGIEVRCDVYSGTPQWSNFFDNEPVGKVFTALTLAHRCLKRSRPNEVESFVKFVRRSLSDENLGYCMEEDGSFRYATDEDFASLRSATLRGLGNTELASAREHYEAAFKAMNEPKDTRAAVRELFEAVEVVARLIAPKYKNLNGTMVRKELLEAAVAAFPGDPIQATKGWPTQFEAFAIWVDGMHNYRHGQPEGRAPTEEFAVLVLTTGGGYLRLLCEMFSRRPAVAH